MGHARALISLGDPKLQVKIFEEIQNTDIQSAK